MTDTEFEKYRKSTIGFLKSERDLKRKRIQSLLKNIVKFYCDSTGLKIAKNLHEELRKQISETEFFIQNYKIVPPINIYKKAELEQMILECVENRLVRFAQKIIKDGQETWVAKIIS